MCSSDLFPSHDSVEETLSEIIEKDGFGVDDKEFAKIIARKKPKIKSKRLSWL